MHCQVNKIFTYAPGDAVDIVIRDSKNPEDQWWVDAGRGFTEQGDNRRALYCFSHVGAPGVRVYNCVQALRGIDSLDAVKVAIQAVSRIPLREDFQTDAAMLYSALGVAYLEARLWPAAEAAFHESLAIDDKQPQVWSDLAFVYQMLGKFEETVHAYKRAILLDPMRVELRTWYAMSQLLLRNWDEGWMHYEARLMHANPMPTGPAAKGARVWTGEDLEGATICLFQEQGHGDLVQFCRYTKLLRERYHAKRILLVCRDVGYRLMRLVGGIDEIYTYGMELPRYDYQTALMSIPGIAYRTNRECVRRMEYMFSNYGPYLKVESPKSLNQDVKRIGVCWRGNGAHKKDHLRSLDRKFTEQLLGGLRSKGTLVNLQFDLTAEEKVAFNYLEMPEWSDLLRIAEVIAGCDVVVTVDTLILHLAGALGVPCLALIQSDADWRHALNYTMSPWYDSVRLHRAAKPFEWGPVIDRVVEAV